jgi:hypothetical protein
VDLLQEVCSETNYLAELQAALLIVQSVRFDPNEIALYGRKANRPRDVLRQQSQAIGLAIRECELHEPEAKDVQRALENFRMFTETEITRLVAELPK